MTDLLDVPLEGGAAFAVEIDHEGTEIVRAAPAGEVVATATKTFEAHLERLQPMEQALVDKLVNLTERPDEIGVEFGLKLSVDADPVIGHSSAEANSRATLQWRQQ